LAHIDDQEGVWEIFSQVIRSGDTYIFDPKTPRMALGDLWFAPHMETYVLEGQGKILGTYIIKPNQIGLGNHIGNCSYMVHAEAQGRGLGKILCAHSLQRAKELRYTGIQFNCVVSTNRAALALWGKFGFRVIGTTPQGFRHATLGLVDTHIMYRDLGDL